MRLHLVLLALTLGCATEDSKTGDTSSNGSDEDGGNLLSQVAEMATEMAEMSAKIAAQQATIAQLEMQMSQTLRWETVEYQCPDEGEEGDGERHAILPGDGLVTASGWRDHTYDGTTYDGIWELDDHSPDLSTEGVVVACDSNTAGYGPIWFVTAGYER